MGAGLGSESGPWETRRAQARYTAVASDAARIDGATAMSTILIIILIILLIGALPSWGYSRGWGYFPSGGLGLVLLIIIILMLMGRL